jgi:hypothetical protein
MGEYSNIMDIPWFQDFLLVAIGFPVPTRAMLPAPICFDLFVLGTTPVARQRLHECNKDHMSKRFITFLRVGQYICYLYTQDARPVVAQQHWGGLQV